MEWPFSWLRLVWDQSWQFTNIIYTACKVHCNEKIRNRAIYTFSMMVIFVRRLRFIVFSYFYAQQCKTRHVLTQKLNRAFIMFGIHNTLFKLTISFNLTFLVISSVEC